MTVPLLPPLGGDPPLPSTDQESSGDHPARPDRNNEPVEDEDADEADVTEEALFRRLVATTTDALANVLQVGYSTYDHGHGETPRKVFTFPLTGDASNLECAVRVQPANFTVTCGLPLRIPADQRGRVAEFIARFNFANELGRFDLDFSDGELLYRIVQDDVRGLADDPSRVGMYCDVACGMMDKHFPALMQVVYGDVSPEQAVRSVETHSSGGSRDTGRALEQ